MAEINIKSMKLYDQVERVFNELAALDIGPDDPIPVETLAQFDQYHYFGTEAVAEAATRLDLDAQMRVVEVGGGIGGPSRYLAHLTGCHMTALELQADLNETAAALTARCGLADRVAHVCGDVLNGVSPSGHYDALVSWLTFLHIPDRDALYRRCFEAVRPGAGIYVEDFFDSGLTPAERVVLANDVYCPGLPSFEDYRRQLEAAGFERIELTDLSSSWVPYGTQRVIDYRAAWDQNVARHGEAIVAGLDHFYSAVAGLFASGHMGGIRVVAWRPTE